MKFNIELISPLIIKDSNELFPIDFFIYDNNSVYRVDIDTTISNISNNKKLLDEFNKIIRMDNPTQQLNDFYSRLEKLNLLSKIYPSIRIDNKEFIKQQNISNYIGFFKTINSKVYYVPYIPGSTIKGAIRNALMYKILKEKKTMYYKNINKDKYIKQNVCEGIKEDIKETKNKKFLNNIEKQIFSYNSKSKDLSLYDIFKYVQITDFIPNNMEKISIGIYPIISHRRNYLNLVLSGQFEGEISINKSLKNQIIKNENKELLEDRLKNLFALEENEINKMPENFGEIERKIILNLLATLQEFTKDNISKYPERYPKININNDTKSYYSFLGSGKGVNLNTVLLALSTTVLPALSTEDRKKVYSKDFPPKTYSLAIINNEYYKPGYVKISLSQSGE